MRDKSLALTDLGEIATRELVKEHKPYALNENKKIVQAEDVAKAAKVTMEEKRGKSIISNKNKLGYKNVDESKLID